MGSRWRILELWRAGTDSRGRPEPPAVSDQGEAWEPNAFCFVIDTFGAAWHAAWWENGLVCYLPSQFAEAVRVRSSRKRWEPFWAAIEEIGVWEWEQQYEPRSYAVLDGTSWGLEIIHQGRRLLSGGCNAYPPGADSAEMSPAFLGFRRAVSELLGGLPLV